MSKTNDVIQQFIDKVKENDFANITKIVQENLETIKNKALKCHEKEFFLAHKIFEKVTDEKLIENVFEQLKYCFRIYENSNKQNWLHCATKSNSNQEVIKYLLNQKKFDAKSTDVFSYTPIHYAFLNHHLKEKYSDELLKELIKSVDSLLLEADDGITPIELLCDNHILMTKLMNLFKAKFTSLLMKIDDVKYGIIITEYDDKYYRISKNFWTLIILTNDKYRLLRYLKKFDYNTLMYVDTNDMENYIKRTSDNGLGILTFVRDEFVSKIEKFSSEALFYKIINSKPAHNKAEFRFCHSSIFLCLITGRLDLVPCLLQYTQFDVVPYAMISCLICERFLQESFISDQIHKSIEKCKDFCEEYAMNVLSLVAIRDLSKRKKVVFKYLTKRNDRFEMQNVLQIAQKANCQRFLGLPICQEVIDLKWTKTHKSILKRLVSPFTKYILSAIIFILYIILFSSLILSQITYKISLVEYIVYGYGITYACEEIKQVIINFRRGLIKNYITDASNVMDIVAIGNLAGAASLRTFLKLPMYSRTTFIKLSKSIFAIRCFLSVSFIFFTMRLLYFASIIQIFGPKLKMITQMVIKDLLPLIVIFSIFIFAFGVVSQSMIYPDILSMVFNNRTSLFNATQVAKLFGDILRRASFTIFDVQYSLVEIETMDLLNSTAESRAVSLVLLMIYMVVVNVMLMNLLIALFSYTVTEIIEQSRVSWKAGRYNFVQEYMDKSLLPPPLNIFIIIIEMINFLKNLSCKKSSCTQKSNNNNNDNVIEITSFENKRLLRHNSSTLENYYTDFMPYYIVQAFALKHKRYSLLGSEEDRNYEAKVHRQVLDNKIDSKFNSIQEQLRLLRTEQK